MTEPQPPTGPGTPDRDMERLNIKVLVADDEPAVSRISVRFLESMGCTVEVVDSGQKLIDRLMGSSKGEFGLVITDQRMPVGGKSAMTGVEALEQIHTNEYLRSLNLPVILNSSGLDDDDLEKVNKYHCTYLQKPCSIKEFQATVLKVVKEHMA